MTREQVLHDREVRVVATVLHDLGIVAPHIYDSLHSASAEERQKVFSAVSYALYLAGISEEPLSYNELLGGDEDAGD